MKPFVIIIMLFTSLLYSQEMEVETSFYTNLKSMNKLDDSMENILLSYNVHWRQTLKADLKDYAAFLKPQLLLTKEREDLLESYNKFRKETKDFIDGGQWDSHFNNTNPDRFVDLKSYKIVKKLPTEMQLYLYGAMAFRAGKDKEAIAFWQDLLKLPKAQRQYKSTWATYMIGRLYYRQQKYKDAKKWFLKTRELNIKGYTDNLNLAVTTSFFMAKMAHMDKQYNKEFLYYMKMFTEGVYPDRFVGFREIRHSFFELTGSRKNPPDSFLNDKVINESLILFLTKNIHLHKFRTRLFTQIHKLKLKTLNSADKLAFVLYKSGRFEESEQWLKLADPKSKITKEIALNIKIRNE